MFPLRATNASKAKALRQEKARLARSEQLAARAQAEQALQPGSQTEGGVGTTNRHASLSRLCLTALSADCALCTVRGRSRDDRSAPLEEHLRPQQRRRATEESLDRNLPLLPPPPPPSPLLTQPCMLPPPPSMASSPLPQPDSSPSPPNLPPRAVAQIRSLESALSAAASRVF